MTKEQIISFVQTNFVVVKERCTNEELVFVCPVPGCPDKSGNRSVNLKTAKTGCWRCSSKGRFDIWVRGLGYEVPKEDEIGHAPLLEDVLSMFDHKPKSKPSVVTVPLPNFSHPMSEEPESAYSKMIVRMAESKRLCVDDMLWADVHFNRLNPRWEGYAIFPVKEYQKVCYYQGRLAYLALEEQGAQGKRFPSRNECPLGSGHWVYNIDEARRPGVDVVIVTEAILNVLSLRKKIAAEGVTNVVPVSVFKHATSKLQLMKLLSCRSAREICVMYDHDATREAEKEAADLYSGLKMVSVAAIPGDLGPTQDPNDDVDSAWESFKRRYKVTPAHSVLV